MTAKEDLLLALKNDLKLVADLLPPAEGRELRGLNEYEAAKLVEGMREAVDRALAAGTEEPVVQ